MENSHCSLINKDKMDNIKEIENMLEISKQERDSIKAQMFDATKRLTELDGIIAALQRSMDILNTKEG